MVEALISMPGVKDQASTQMSLFDVQRLECDHIKISPEKNTNALNMRFRRCLHHIPQISFSKPVNGW
jgi:hypothetical protein